MQHAKTLEKGFFLKETQLDNHAKFARYSNCEWVVRTNRKVSVVYCSWMDRKTMTVTGYCMALHGPASSLSSARGPGPLAFLTEKNFNRSVHSIVRTVQQYMSIVRFQSLSLAWYLRTSWPQSPHYFLFHFDCWVLFSRQGAETPAAGILEFGPSGHYYYWRSALDKGKMIKMMYVCVNEYECLCIHVCVCE